MNLDSLISSSAIRSETITATLNRHNYPSAHQTMPQRSPFAIQELLGLGHSDSMGAGGHGVYPANEANYTLIGGICLDILYRVGFLRYNRGNHLGVILGLS